MGVLFFTYGTTPCWKQPLQNTLRWAHQLSLLGSQTAGPPQPQGRDQLTWRESVRTINPSVLPHQPGLGGNSPALGGFLCLSLLHDSPGTEFQPTSGESHTWPRKPELFQVLFPSWGWDL
jgi:hypothetical protein